MILRVKSFCRSVKAYKVLCQFWGSPSTIFLYNFSDVVGIEVQGNFKVESGDLIPSCVLTVYRVGWRTR